MIDKTNTPEEIVDIVNEKDQIIGKDKKAIVNSNPNLIHREIVIFLYDKNDNLLFQQRSPKKIVQPLYWSASVAGHIPTGLSPLEGAHRELIEELGFDTDLELQAKELVKLENETHFAYCYLGEYNGDKIVLEPEEVEQVKFISQKEYLDFEKESLIDDLSKSLARGFWKLTGN